MTPIALRESFRAFAGDENFRRFVHAINTAPFRLKRLRYWQEELWNEFRATTPDCTESYAEIQQLFAICEVHGYELERDTVLAPYSQLRYHRTESPDSGLHSGMMDTKQYPYPGWGVSPSDWPPAENRMVDVLYCPRCRELRSEREAENGG